ncbi:cytochrome C oxidase subunit IV [Winogradskyella sp. PC-19]|uniref:CcoQ/FixQ family Cbb3-type cytochrome c oxidase assembly chaperone n=1 Tax=unclassified Winogradskyella TaxID=2615021 RepID=UPI000B3D414C|nr:MULTISPECIES: CcoQ/FixQ family Cbb3-type cytochrome c oxidase assembly chaperone [unclassified Winogradskyella]ARV08911.1 cytochrome C oxidase subunit IV [Winogradskyella sp. PC-19]RZN78458.1 MAG: CcoQ/FixQ family Cbb3-type cytochrome c oxidase assembly chaperone [Winogradskyella sp.]
MFKFIKGHLETITGIEIYPMISLLIFFIFFVTLFYWVFTAKKDYITKVSNLPLDNQNETLS